MGTIPHEDQREGGFRRDRSRPRAVIVSDVRLFRESLASSLATRSDIDIVNSVAADARAIRFIASARPEIILLDAAASDACRFVRDITARVPATWVIAFAPPASGPAALPFAGSGVAACVDRDASADELVALLHRVLHDKFLRATGIAGPAFRPTGALSASGPASVSTRLTARQREIMDLIDRGLSNKQTARDLRLSHATVKNHVHNILDKLDVHRRGEAAARLRGVGLPH